VLVTLVLTFWMLVLGELAPKRIAMQRAQGWGLMVARPLALLDRLARPAAWLLSKATDATVRLAGADPHERRQDLSDEELRDLLTTRRRFTPQQRHIVKGAFDIAERSLREILVPRGNVYAIPAHTPANDAARELARRGFSRAPVMVDGLDDILGVLHLRDLAGANGTGGRLGSVGPDGAHPVQDSHLGLSRRAARRSSGSSATGSSRRA
jgi:putative hemolysin